MSTHPLSRQARFGAVTALTFAAGLLSNTLRAESGLPVETVDYSFEDFADWLPKIRQGRADALGNASPAAIPGEAAGKGVRLTWDLTAAGTPTNNFIDVAFHRPIAGLPQQIRLRIHASAESVGTPLKLKLRDASGEQFIASARIPAEGWSDVAFSLNGLAPAWKSGDANGRMDLPVRLDSLSLEHHGHKGEFILDAMRVVARGTPRELMLARLESKLENLIGWGAPPECRLVLENHASTATADLTVAIEAVDLATGKVTWQSEQRLPALAGAGRADWSFRPDIPQSAVELKFAVRDAAGDFPVALGRKRAARMMGDLTGVPAGPGERDYMRKWGLLGGIFWSCPPERVARIGGTWERLTVFWKHLERRAGDLETGPAVARARQLRELGLDTVYFNTVYNQPAFFPLDRPAFAPNYGRLHRELARAFGPLVQWYELGNEDNGPTKFLYAEVARHGAAGVRSEAPQAMIGNSGTAQVDVAWLRAQARRRLLDRFDALITHPYSWSSSPEDYGVLEQLGQVEQLIDELGGMKVQLTTEFGYPEKFDQLQRAQWIPRHLAIGAAAGLRKHGLYAWDDHFGIHAHGDAHPAAVSLNAHSFLTFGHRFAGWLRKDHDVWAAVYDRAGRPLVMAWSPTGKGTLDLPPAAQAAVVYDLFGNRIRPEDFPSRLALGGSPVYVSGLDTHVLETAYSTSRKAAEDRFRKLLAKLPPEAQAEWTPAAAEDSALRAALFAWQPKDIPVSPAEQAVVAQGVRKLILASRAGRLEAVPAADTAARWDVWKDALAQSVQAGLDNLSLRWLLESWREIRDEAAMAREQGGEARAQALAGLEPVFDRLCHVFSASGKKLFFPIWPYLHAPSQGEQPLVERLRFIPAKPVPAAVRLVSYAKEVCDTEVRLDLPPDWKCEPPAWSGRIEPGQSLEVSFRVTAGGTVPPAIAAVLAVPGKPEIRIPFDDFEVLPELDISVPVLSQLLPRAPLPLEITNNANKRAAASIRVCERAGLPALAKAQTGPLVAGSGTAVRIQLPGSLPRPPFNEWALVADVTTVTGKKLEVPLTVDFDVCVRADHPPQIDGNLSDWATAAPLHLNRPDFTRGSFGNAWSADDLSGVVYTMWDDRFFYIAARVRDQLFNQNLTGGNSWNQDSVQFALAAEDGNSSDEFSMALTPEGPQVWNHLAAEVVPDAALRVGLLQGETLYEAAIPWSAFSEFRRGAKGRFDVVFNDDDAIVNRRFMERYGTGIVHGSHKGGRGKSPHDFGWLNFGASAGPPSADSDARRLDRLFLEDFEEYAPDRRPDDVWTAVGRETPLPECLVRAGAGVDGTQALVLRNPVGDQPQVYHCLTRPLSGLQPGRKYVMQARVKGSGIAKTQKMLGVCSDRYANEGYQTIPPWQPSDQWQDVRMEFTAPGGVLNVFIRNEGTTIDHLAIDDLEIAEAKP